VSDSDTSDFFEKRTIVSFGIFGEDLDPDQVSENLKLVPEHTHRKGDYPRNDPKYSAYKHGMWGLDSKLPREQDFSAHLDNLLTILEPKQAEIRKLSERYDVDFYCNLFSQIGFNLLPDLLKRMGNIGAALGVTVYGGDG
jgi:hypothetical protein